MAPVGARKDWAVSGERLAFYTTKNLGVKVKSGKVGNTEGPTWEFNPEGGPVKGWRAPKWSAKWHAPSALMSTAEGAEPPAEPEDDPDAEDDAPIPLATVSEATIKRHVALLLRRLLLRAEDFVLSAGKSIPGTVAIHSHERPEPAAAGSVVGLVHEILLGTRWQLSARKIWDILRAMIPKTEEEHWKLGAKSFLINLTLEKRQFAVLAILTELVQKEGMAAALTDFGTTDEEHLACARRVCTLLDAFHTSTVVIPAAKTKGRARKAPAGDSAGGSSSSNPPPTPRTPSTKVALKSGAEELAAYQPSQVRSAADLLGKNSSPIMQNQNISPASRKRFRDTLNLVVVALVAEIPQERPEGVLGTNALMLLQYIASTGGKTMKADAARLQLQQRSLFPAGESGAADEEEEVEDV